MVGYVSVALVVSLVGITYQISKTMFMASNEKNLKLFEEDANSETMKAYVNFIAETGRTYADK